MSAMPDNHEARVQLCAEACDLLWRRAPPRVIETATRAMMKRALVLYTGPAYVERRVMDLYVQQMDALVIVSAKTWAEVAAALRADRTCDAGPHTATVRSVFLWVTESEVARGTTEAEAVECRVHAANSARWCAAWIATSRPPYPLGVLPSPLAVYQRETMAQLNDLLTALGAA